MTDKENTTPQEVIMNKIYLIRGQKVMLDRDLAVLYGVKTKVLNQAVQRNPGRFPPDFMFQLNNQEFMALRSQIVTSNRGGSRYRHFAFSEMGVAMLSTVLNSEKAIAVNIEIMRVFTRLRQMLFDNTELRLAIEELRKESKNNKQNIEVVFKYLDELLDKREQQKAPGKIGFKP